MKALVLAGAVCVLFAFAAMAAVDGLLFEASFQHKVGYEPYRICIADFNADGISDMACAHYTGDSLAVLIGKGDGDYQPAVFYTVGGYQTDIQAGNIDGDADIELVVARYDAVYTLDNNGDGTFATAVQVSALANSPQTIRLANIDVDSDLELIVAHNDFSYTNLSVWENDGSGNFTIDNQYAVGVYQRVMAVADFDGVNGVDIAVGTASPNTFSILLNDGSGNYNVTASSPYALASDPRGMCSADFDGANGIDIAITRYGNLTVYTNDGSGNFSVGSSLGRSGNGYSLSAADFDGANGPDIALGDDSVYVYYNNGSGVMSSVNEYWVGEYSEGLAAGDLDNDGYLDLAVVGRPGNYGTAANHIAVLLNPVGNGQFMYALQTPTGGSGWNYPVSLCRADFDTDGIIDVATLDWVNDSVLVYLGDGAGHFTSCFRWPVANAPCEIVAMDVDGANTDDLVIGHSDNAGTSISILLSVGGGNFAPPVLYTAATKPMGIFVGELNGTGLADIATLNPLANNIAVLFNQGVGVFGAASYYPAFGAPNHSAIDGGDFNNDGAIDLVIPNSSNGCVQVFWNDGFGGFGASNNVGLNMMYDPYQVHVADLDGNNYDDIIVGSYDSCEVAVVMSSGSGFGTPSIYYAGWEQYEISTSDFDADGFIDIVVLNTESYNFTILFGDGTGNFTNGGHYGIISDDSEGLAVADFDNDGFPDVAVSNYNHDNISVMLSRYQILTPVTEIEYGDPLPERFMLGQNYPNPFNPMTTITYSLPAAARVKVAIYNLLGQRVRVFDEGLKQAGEHSIVWDGRDRHGSGVATGLYFYKLTADDYSESKKMLLLK